MGKRPKAEKPELTPKQAKYLERLLAHGNQQRAAEEAGYGSNAHAITKSKAVRYALKEVREKAIVAAAYNADAAMREADEAIEFARETKNANAYVKAVELKSKLQGLLVEKHQHQVANFSLHMHGVRRGAEQAQEVPAEVLATVKSVEEDDEDPFA